MRSNHVTTCTTNRRICTPVLTIPLALATLSTTVAAINSSFITCLFNFFGPPGRLYTPCAIDLADWVPPLFGVKNTISNIDRQPYNNITLCPSVVPVFPGLPELRERSLLISSSTTAFACRWPPAQCSLAVVSDLQPDTSDAINKATPVSLNLLVALRLATRFCRLARIPAFNLKPLHQ